MIQARKLAMGFTLMVIMALLLTMTGPAQACPSDGRARECKDCILDRMKYGCPSCMPLLRCMARCLWTGTSSRSKCVKKCDCGGGKPTLSDCKKCMSRCKCSCAAYQ